MYFLLQTILTTKLVMPMSDLISREKLLDYLQMIPIDLGYREVESIRTFVKHMPPAQEWIPVSERLPENSEKVLITRRTIRFTKDDSGRCIDIGFYYSNLKKWYTIDLDYIEVLAWMPLPEPYRGGDKG